MPPPPPTTPTSDSHVGRFVEQAFDRHGDYDAIFFEGRWHRLSSLRDRSRRIAGGLIDLGSAQEVTVTVTEAPKPRPVDGCLVQPWRV